MSAVVKTNERRLRVYCPTHRVSFERLEGGRIVCDLGPHTLAERFPRGEFWEYCCDCLSFAPSVLNVGGAAGADCVVCGRQTARRFLCAECNVVSIESDERRGRKPYTLADGAVRPVCPGCGQSPSARLLGHDCEVAGASFGTARGECPFCHEAIIELPAFPAQLAEYLEKIDSLPVGKTVVRYDYLRDGLVPSPEGDYILLKTGGSKLAVVLPRVGHFNSRQDFYSRYERCYACDTPAGGEIFINYPAVVEKDEDGWKLKELGRLEVDKFWGSAAGAGTAPAAEPAPDAEPVCLGCGGSRRPNSVYCAECGGQSAAAEEGAYEELLITDDPSPAVGEVGAAELDDSGEASGRRSALRKVAVGVVVVALLVLSGLLIMRSVGAWTERRFKQAIERGNLVRPQGDSARDLYRQLKQEGGGSYALASLERELLPKLVGGAQQVLAEFAEPGTPDPGLERWQEAADMLEWAAEIEPNDGRVLARSAYCKGRIAYLQGDHAGALEEWKRAGELDQTWAMPPNGVGLVYNEQKRYALARTYLLEAARRAPEWAVPYNNVGTTYYGVNDYRQAAVYYRKAVEYAPTWARPHAWLGDIAMRQRDYSTAAREFELVLSPSAVGTASMDLDKIRQVLAQARQLQGR